MGDSKADIIEEIKSDLQIGRYFAVGVRSADSVRGYQPVLNREDWASVVKTLGLMARESDPLAQVATVIMRHLNLYGTRSQLEAAVYKGAYEAVMAHYDDVVGRAGPEPPNPRFWKRPFTLDECIAIACWVQAALDSFRTCCVPGRGWALDEIARKSGIRLPPDMK